MEFATFSPGDRVILTSVRLGIQDEESSFDYGIEWSNGSKSWHLAKHLQYQYLND